MCVKFMSVFSGTFLFLCIVMFEQFKLYELQEREGQTDRQRQTDRQTDKVKERETERQADREILPASSVRFLFSALSWTD